MGSDVKDKGLLAVQILRAGAALSVCTVHFQWFAMALEGHPNDPIPTYPLAAGVDVFFVISGFVMVYSSEGMFEAQRATAIFLWRRLVRIAPLYWLTTAISIPLLSTAFDTASIVKSLLFIPYRAGVGNFQPIYGVGWTLNFEMFFYVVFASTIIFSRNVAVLLCAAIISVGVLVAKLMPVSLPVPLQFWTDPIAIEFVFGMFLALAYRSGFRLPRWAGFLLLTIGIFTIWFGLPNQPPSGGRLLFCGIPAAVIFAGLVFQPGLPARLFGWIGSLGDASYSIYLTHTLIVATAFVGWHHGLNQFSIGTVMFSVAIITILVSMATYRWFEKPITSWLRISPRDRAAAGEVVAAETL